MELIDEFAGRRQRYPIVVEMVNCLFLDRHRRILPDLGSSRNSVSDEIPGTHGDR